MKDLVRWILVLPGGILGGLIATFPLHWFLVGNFGASESDDHIITLSHSGLANLEIALTPFVIAYVYMVIGAGIAPNRKFYTALVLSGLYAAAMLYIFFGVGLPIGFGWKTAGAIAGIALGLLTVFKYKRRLGSVHKAIPYFD